MTETDHYFREAIPLPNLLPGFRPFVTIPTTLALFAGFVVVIALFCFLVGIDPKEGLPVAIVLAAPFFLLAIFSRVRLGIVCRMPYAVSCLNGVVIERSDESRISYPLRECAWFVGRTTDDLRFGDAGVSRPCLIIVRPIHRRVTYGRRGDRWVACGLTPEMDVRWREAFGRYGCPRVWRDRGFPSLLLGAWVILGPLVVLHGSGRLGRGLVTQVLGPLGIPVPVPVVIGSLLGLFMPLIFLILGLIPIGSPVRRGALRSLRIGVLVGPFCLPLMFVAETGEPFASLIWCAAIALLGLCGVRLLPANEGGPQADDPIEGSEPKGDFHNGQRIVR